MSWTLNKAAAFRIHLDNFIEIPGIRCNTLLIYSMFYFFQVYLYTSIQGELYQLLVQMSFKR